jgi:hypothetical protein
MTGLLTSYLDSGLLADRPLVPLGLEGALCFFQAEDESKLYRYNWDSELWEAIGEGFADAPEGSELYLRTNGEWVLYEPSEAGIPDAPSDGTQYARKDGAWVAIESQAAGIEEAPEDGVGYVRKDGAWAAESVGGGGSSTPPWFDPPILAELPELFGNPLQYIQDSYDGLIMYADGPSPVVSGRSQAIPNPNADWTATARIDYQMLGSPNRFANVGIITQNAGKTKQLTWGWDTRERLHHVRFSNVGYDGLETLIVWASAPPNWFRIRYDAAAGITYFEVSVEGKVWILMAQDTADTYFGGKPAFAGIFLVCAEYPFRLVGNYGHWTLSQS